MSPRVPTGSWVRVFYRGRFSTRPAPAVEVLDLLVAPGQRAADVSLPGGAVFEVRAGNGVLTTSGMKEDLKTGSMFVVSQGARFTVENTGDVPVTMRVFVITFR